MSVFIKFFFKLKDSEKGRNDLSYSTYEHKKTNEGFVQISVEEKIRCSIAGTIWELFWSLLKWNTFANCVSAQARQYMTQELW